MCSIRVTVRKGKTMKTLQKKSIPFVVNALSPKDLSKGIDVRATAMSSTGKGSYTVTRRNGQWACSCPAWKFRSPRKDCKHIQAVRSIEGVTLAVA